MKTESRVMKSVLSPAREGAVAAVDTMDWVLDRSIWREMGKKTSPRIPGDPPGCKRHGESPVTAGETALRSGGRHARLWISWKLKRSLSVDIPWADTSPRPWRITRRSIAGLSLIASRLTAVRHQRQRIAWQNDPGHSDKGVRVLAESLAPRLSCNPHVSKTKAFAMMRRPTLPV